jgi:large subunit ribosomal protein L31
MKPKIHPEYVDAVIKCACGNEVKTKSIKKEIRVEICARCHPFYTGKEKIIDTMGRVEKFRRKYERAKEKIEKEEAKTKRGRKKKEEKEESLNE